MSSDKYALLIGVTYPNSNAYLPGCDNDIFDIYKFLKQRGYTNFDVLCDTNIFDSQQVNVRAPTFSEICNALYRLMLWAKEHPNTDIFLHYSGHGTQVADSNWVFDSHNKTWCTEETDGKDECIVSQDLRLITDDQLKWVFSCLPTTVNLFSIMDSCHSGSSFDLKYYLKNINEPVTETTQSDINANVVMFSGCRDDQYSQSSVFNKKWYGVMSYSFLYLMNHMSKYNVNQLSIGDIWKYIGIISSGFPQLPQVSASKSDFYLGSLVCSNTAFGITKNVTTRALTNTRTNTNTRTQTTTKTKTNTRTQTTTNTRNHYFTLRYSKPSKSSKSRRWAMF